MLYHKDNDCLYLSLFDYPIRLIPLPTMWAMLLYQAIYACLILFCFRVINDLETHRRRILHTYLND